MPNSEQNALVVLDTATGLSRQHALCEIVSNVPHVKTIWGGIAALMYLDLIFKLVCPVRKAERHGTAASI
jgi:hypothetical protein